MLYHLAVLTDLLPYVFDLLGLYYASQRPTLLPLYCGLSELHCEIGTTWPKIEIKDHVLAIGVAQ